QSTRGRSDPRRSRKHSPRRPSGFGAVLGFLDYIRAVAEPGNQTQVKRATSALADVDTTGWTQRFDLLSDPNRLEILLVLHRAPGINVGDLASVLGRSENAVDR